MYSNKGDPVMHTQRLQESCAWRQRARISGAAFVIGFMIASLALLAPRTAFAQASAGITGTVTDSSGAVVPDAKVTVTNEGTSISAHTTTSSAGTYAFRGLTPGKYNVAVEAHSFKKSVQKDINVEVSTTDTIDVALTAGGADETVQVTADQVALNTTQPELGSTIEPVVVAALPEEVSGRGRQIDS